MPNPEHVRASENLARRVAGRPVAAARASMHITRQLWRAGITIAKETRAPTAASPRRIAIAGKQLQRYRVLLGKLPKNTWGLLAGSVKQLEKKYGTNVPKLRRIQRVIERNLRKESASVARLKKDASASAPAKIAQAKYRLLWYQSYSRAVKELIKRASPKGIIHVNWNDQAVKGKFRHWLSDINFRIAFTNARGLLLEKSKKSDLMQRQEERNNLELMKRLRFDAAGRFLPEDYESTFHYLYDVFLKLRSVKGEGLEKQYARALKNQLRLIRIDLRK